MPIGCHACQSWYCSRCVSGWLFWGESTAVDGVLRTAELPCGDPFTVVLRLFWGDLLSYYAHGPTPMTYSERSAYCVRPQKKRGGALGCCCELKLFALRPTETQSLRVYTEFRGIARPIELRNSLFFEIHCHRAYKGSPGTVVTAPIPAVRWNRSHATASCNQAVM